MVALGAALVSRRLCLLVQQDCSCFLQRGELQQSRAESTEQPAAAAYENRRLIKHARYYWLLLAESHLTRRLFAGMLRKIAALPSPAG